MSVTFEIGCLDCRKKLWIGQGRFIYKGDAYITRLEKFLLGHTGHLLMVADENMVALEEFEEMWDPENDLLKLELIPRQTRCYKNGLMLPRGWWDRPRYWAHRLWMYWLIRTNQVRG
jgi:hypothetical protein